MSDREAIVSFGGARVGLLESRLAEEAAGVVRRFGGDPIVAPSVREVAVDATEAVTALAERLRAEYQAIVVFLTGVAVHRLFAAAERAECDGLLLDGLSRCVTVARGPKPAGALARHGAPASRTVPEPFTTAEVIATLESMSVTARSVTVVHYGEPNAAIVSHLASRGARVHELLLYEWQLPEDVTPLSRLVDDIVNGSLRILAFTSQVQVRHLLEVAGSSRRTALVDALNNHVLVGAVGPTCAAACAAAGIHAAVVPDRPKLVPLLQELALTHAARRSASPPTPIS